jgi:hypothetical protein
MARARPRRSLTRLAADHPEAAEQGIPVDAVREARERARDREPAQYRAVSPWPGRPLQAPPAR